MNGYSAKKLSSESLSLSMADDWPRALAWEPLKLVCSAAASRVECPACWPSLELDLVVKFDRNPGVGCVRTISSPSCRTALRELAQ